MSQPIELTGESHLVVQSGIDKANQPAVRVKFGAFLGEDGLLGLCQKPTG